VLPGRKEEREWRTGGMPAALAGLRKYRKRNECGGENDAAAAVV
jgi:hypothetical protein